nr:hypothetical protein [candidate division Zixibacteria bacterium]
MENTIGIIIKMILALTVIIGALLYFIIPRTKLAGKLKMNESVFIITSVTGIICGAVGLVVTLFWPEYIVNLHLWEFIIMPFILANVYWGIIMKTRKTVKILDEKQVFDLTNAAALTWAGSIPAMVVIFLLYSWGIVDGVIWFPFYFFITLLFFSISTLFCFKKS